MNKALRILMCVGAAYVALSNASELATVSNDDWIAAAQVALASAERQQHSIAVIDATLPLAAQAALKQVRTTISLDELPDREKYDLPPGPFLRVRQFRLNGDRFEFQITRGTIPKHGMRNCGVTSHFFVARDADGAWTLDGFMTESMC